MESGKEPMVQLMEMKFGALTLTNTNITSIKVSQATTNLAMEERNNNGGDFRQVAMPSGKHTNLHHLFIKTHLQSTSNKAIMKIMPLLMINTQ